MRPRSLTLDLPAFAQDALKLLLREPGILDADLSAGHLRAVIADMFQCSWMTVEGSSMVSLTRRGTRPGDPLADILFSLALAPILLEVEEKF